MSFKSNDKSSGIFHVSICNRSRKYSKHKKLLQALCICKREPQWKVTTNRAFNSIFTINIFVINGIYFLLWEFCSGSTTGDWCSSHSHLWLHVCFICWLLLHLKEAHLTFCELFKMKIYTKRKTIISQIVKGLRNQISMNFLYHISLSITYAWLSLEKCIMKHVHNYGKPSNA